MGTTSRKGNLCLVKDCRVTATDYVAIASEVPGVFDTLDLRVCTVHADAIQRAPHEWKVTSYPTVQENRDSTVIVPVGTELGVAKKRPPANLADDDGCPND